MSNRIQGGDSERSMLSPEGQGLLVRIYADPGQPRSRSNYFGQSLFRESNKHRPILKNPKVVFATDTVTSPESLQKAFEGADGVFHQAAIASVPRSVKNPLATNEANITGTLNVLIAARDCGVKKVLYASSSSVYGDTPTLPKREDMKPLPKSPVCNLKIDRGILLPGLF